MAITKTRKNYKPGDIVLVSSPAGDVIPKVHVKLKKRIIVKERKGRLVGFKKSMDWPGYSGWEATLVYQDEISTGPGRVRGDPRAPDPGLGTRGLHHGSARQDGGAGRGRCRGGSGIISDQS